MFSTESINPNVIELAVLLVVLGVLSTVAVVVITKIRPKPVQQEPLASELLSKYREMHSRGELSDAEFRTIKTTLAERFQRELRDDGETGCDA
ncbi:MAG: hypothetical protein JW888_00845 [Pirellulales bacterium]|nr:hypothetical protein [Pirellulales bacterium]